MNLTRASETPLRTPRTWMHNGAPVLVGFVTIGRNTGSINAWCPWCCNWHSHGYTDETPGTTTHRAAHCRAADSPYRSTGYYLHISDAPWGPFQNRMKVANFRQQQIIADGRTTPGIEKLRAQPQPVG